jgi:hypothetical protein
LLFYTFPLVFYVNPNMPKLAERIEQGLQTLAPQASWMPFLMRITAKLQRNST